MITKKELTDVLGLSCVERYFSAWLSKFYDVTGLYGSAFAGFSQILDDFSQGATYQSYGYLPRLQDVAEEYGIVTHEYRPCHINEAESILRAVPDDTLCLIRVNTAFFTDFKRASWREDHYVCVNGELEWINEYPLAEGRFSQERFASVYDGALCLYYSADKTAAVPNMISSEFVKQNYNISRFPSGLGNLESAVGVLRITRKRMEKYYAKNETVVKALKEENALLDKIYFEIRLHRLREKSGEKRDKNKEYAELCEKLQSVIATEKRAAEALKK